MEWKPIEKASLKVPKGFLRVYSYKPTMSGQNMLRRTTNFECCYGYRECDLYMDIPAPPELTTPIAER